MNNARVLFIAAALVISVQTVSAQDLSRYRVYALDSSLESVVAAAGLDLADAKTLHKRPAKIQELEWRAPYVSFGTDMADPVRGIVFTFFNDALYQVVVSYDRERTGGLTNSDIIESLSAVYGAPVIKSARSVPAVPLHDDTVVLAQWENPASSLTLHRGLYAADFQLVLIAKALNTRARGAIREAIRLDTIEAPRRELEQRKQDAADATAAREKARAMNKPAFRP